MVRTKDLTIAVGLLVLCISGVTAAYTLDEALAYSVTGKVCTDSESIKLAKQDIQDVQKGYQTRASIQSEIDILKAVRDLINKAKASIIRIDSGVVAFVQTADLSKLRDAGYDEIMDLIEVMNSTSDPVDKVALCDKIITAINEIVDVEEALIARSDYDNIPNLLTSIINSIDVFLVNCAAPPPVDTSDGSIKIGTVDNNGTIKINDGSAQVGGDGSVQIISSSSNGNGSAQVGGNGSAQINSTKLITVHSSSFSSKKSKQSFVETSRKNKQQDNQFVAIKLNSSKKSKKHSQQQKQLGL